jgi:pimeloyl-ACP methyl ester carboxylesterase
MQRLKDDDTLNLSLSGALLREQRIQVTGRQSAVLAAEAAGQGKPLVWNHALLGSMAQDLGGGVLAWRDLVDIARVIRFDARGHGRSDSTGTPEDYSWANQARSLWEVVDHFDEERVVLGGASMGSGISLHAACQKPDRVKGLVLAIPPRIWEWREGKASGYRLTANVVKWSRGLPFRLLGRIPFSSGNASFRENVRGVMARDLATADHRGVVGAMRGAALSDFPAREALASLEAPALILAWPEDDIHPLAVAQELHRVLPNSRLEVASQEQDPYAWPQKVRDFLESLD